MAGSPPRLVKGSTAMDFSGTAAGAAGPGAMAGRHASAEEKHGGGDERDEHDRHAAEHPRAAGAGGGEFLLAAAQGGGEFPGVLRARGRVGGEQRAQQGDDRRGHGGPGELLDRQRVAGLPLVNLRPACGPRTAPGP